jgi:hypothetical protein
MAEQKPEKKPSIVEKLKKLAEDFVEDLRQLVDPPRPVRVPVTAGWPPRRR